MNTNKQKKASFRVRRIYYDQFANDMKTEELRALTAYWIKILQPPVPLWMAEHSLLDLLLTYQGDQPEIAVIHTPKLPTLNFKIGDIYIAIPECVLGRELSEQGKKDIPTELCIVTKLGERIR